MSGVKDFKGTLWMPKTDFPMRGNLPTREPHIQEKWESDKLYEARLAKNKGRKKFILLDGPPYANGNIHMGHALNKVLKDIIVRYRSMAGFDAPYIPGWDTHGLPIEQALVNQKKVKRHTMSVADFRALCEAYAKAQIEGQKMQFKRLGMLGDWQNPYMTLAKEFEAEQLLVFGKMAQDGLIYKGEKPIYWSPSSETALAEAEIEYKDKKSASIYVAFKVKDGKGLLTGDEAFVIWTTTPWTIPANLGIAVHAELDYSVIAAGGRQFIVAKELVSKLAETLNWSDYSEVAVYKGKQFEQMVASHPLYGRDSLVMLGDHVTLDAGTGLVHTAPGHGEDDFNMGKAYGLDVLCPVDGKGKYTAAVNDPELEGLYYDDANKVITARLEACGALLKLSFMTHSYPHDWRTKKPIIFRTTSQWFASIDALKETILSEIEKVNWINPWGEVRIANMFKDRDEWCISRQRVWGVPIPVFYAEDESPIIDAAVIAHVAELVREHGTNIWFERDAKDLLPEGFTHPKSPNGKFTKETDIMDVWFDSGTVHQGVLKARLGAYPADLFLEGSDQYRGWFNSSLTTGVAVTGKAPYKAVLSHGFALDGKGFKMSKSLGNVIDPLKVMKQYGTDIVRLWVASVDYQSDVRISDEIMKQVSDTYRKIRNTFRFLLGNLGDFDPAVDQIDFIDMPEVDQLMLVKLNQLTADVLKAYDSYCFDDVSKLINNYIASDLSAFYLDFTKDILYIEEKEGMSRRAVQTVLYAHALNLTLLLTPIIPHTTEEIYSHLPGEKEASVYLVDLPEIVSYSTALDEKWAPVFEVRDALLKALEEAREAKVIGKSFEAHATITLPQSLYDALTAVDANLRQIFILSGLELVVGAALDFEIKKAEGHTCARCWQVVEVVNEDGICVRCADVVAKL
ncbi:MAG: isoleucine--tRNA ligase [Defluviitaleaceae bacterium]|nr:isoleucine--tRNA ligase [Defluviitaleaceae bacterium]